MHISAAPPRDVVADAIVRLVDGRAWSGSVAELHAAISAAATGAERDSCSWPASPTALARCLRGQTDALRMHGLRMSIMPDDLLIERVRTTGGMSPEIPIRPATPAGAVA